MAVSSLTKRFNGLFKRNPEGASYIALFRPINDLHSRFILVCAIFCAIAAGIPLPIIGVIFSKIINSFPPTENELTKTLSELVGVACAYFLVTWGWTTCWGIIGERVSRGLRTEFLDRALGLDQTYYETVCPDITACLTTDAQNVQAGTSEKIGLFIVSISYFVAAFTVGFILNAKLTGILFAGVIPTMAIVIYTGTTILNRFAKAVAGHTTTAAAVAEGAIKAVQAVQAFGAAKALTAEHSRHLKLAMTNGIKKSLTAAVLLGSIYFVAFSANALAFWEGSRLIGDNPGSGAAGTIYAIVFLILDASFVIGQCGPFIQIFAGAATAGKRILDVIDHPITDIDVYSKAGVVADGKTLDNDIEFKDITFSYPARPDKTILEKLNLKLEAGTTIGIVGASGSGKSTIAALLMRLYDPASGSINVANQDISKFNLASLRRQISLVDQQPALFSGTILTNIRQGLTETGLTDEDIRERCTQAARDADAWSFIQALPKGLDTQVGEPSGTKLSGGQRQRICLARALVRNPSLLVLDEATSALDTISEALILQALRKARSSSRRITVAIAHRLNTVRDADKIIVMGDGKLLEEGSHGELMKKDGAYAKLVAAQQLESPATPESEVCADSSDDDELNNLEEKVLTRTKSAKSVKLEAKPDEIPMTSMGAVRRCIHLSRKHWPYTLLALAGSAMTGSLIIGESLIFGHLVNILNASTPSYSDVKFYSLMFFVIALIAITAYTVSGTFFGVVSENLIVRTREISLETILKQDVEWFMKPGHSPAALMSVLSSDSTNISGLSGVILGTIVSGLVSVCGGAILAHIVAWKIAIVLFATAPIVVLAGFFRLRVLSQVEERNQKAYTEAAAIAIEACNAMRTVTVLGAEKSVSGRFKEAIDSQYKRNARPAAMSNLLFSFALSITYFVYALAYWWGAKQVREGKYNTLQFFIVLPAVLFSAQTAGQMFSLAPEVGRAKTAAMRVFALHDQKPTIDTGSSGSETTLVETKSSQKGIEFRDVCLTYPTRPKAPVFTNLSLKIQPGETVAMVGRSGAGKTSVISLIERFYDPTSGTVLIDGQDIRSMDVHAHRARVSLVEQDPALFAGSVSFNVGLGKNGGQGVTQKEIEAACKAVGVHDFIMGLPDGYNTPCGINGSQLSGGQKQRIAIARAYLRDADILLLDEATSALDSHSEAQVQEAISVVSKTRTTIIVAHRLTSVQKADRILVFDQGRIAEEGKHEQLMKVPGGIYAQMIAGHMLG